MDSHYIKNLAAALADELVERGQSGTRWLPVVPGATMKTGLSRAHLYNEIAAGKIPVARVGRALRIKEADLDAYMTSHVVSRVDGEA